MSRLDTINLIRLFDFYLAVVFLFSFRRRYRVYWDALRLVLALHTRWPRLVDRLRVYRGILLTREVVRPTLLALLFMAGQFALSRGLFPQATITFHDLAQHWFCLLLVAVAALPMLGVDGYFLLRVGRFNRGETEAYLDQAEQWLGTWKAGFLRTVTFGWVDPHRIVDDEVRKALIELGEMVRWSMWWIAAQIACRTIFGLTLWLSWLFC